MRKLLASILAIGLVGCAGNPLGTNVEVFTTVYKAPSYAAGGAISISAVDKKLEGSLEFEHVKRSIAEAISTAGYRLTSDIGSASHVAFVSYGIDSGRSEVSSVPVFGQTGGGVTNSSGTVSSGGSVATYSGSTYKMPTFGVVGVGSESSTVYKRVFAMDIVEGDSYRTDNPKKLIELRAKSEGSCGNINAILPYLIKGALRSFPGEDGKTKRAVVPAPTDFC